VFASDAVGTQHKLCRLAAGKIFRKSGIPIEKFATGPMIIGAGRTALHPLAPAGAPEGVHRRSGKMASKVYSEQANIGPVTDIAAGSLSPLLAARAVRLPQATRGH
jgi:hypothetical protein